MENEYIKIQEVIQRAYTKAVSERSEYLTIEHLLEQVLLDDEIGKIFKENGSDASLLAKKVREYLLSDEHIQRVYNRMPKKTVMLERVLYQAKTQASFFGLPFFSIPQLFMALIEEENTFCHALLTKEKVLSNDELLDEIARKCSPKSLEQEGEGPGHGQGEVPEFISPFGKKKPVQGKEAIEKYCISLNDLALDGKFDTLVGREKEIQSLQETLVRKNKPNAILLGNPGVGKTQIVEGFARNIIDEEVPEELFTLQLHQLDLTALVAGTRFRGEFEERIKAVIDGVKEDPNIVLFIDEVHQLIDAGSADGAMNAANILKPALARGEIRVIGATTDDEYRKFFEKDRALMRRFQKVKVDEPTPEETKTIMKSVKAGLETFHKVNFSDAAVDAAVDLTVKYIQNRYLPDKAIDALDIAAARKKLTPDPHVGLHDVQDVVAQIAGLPIESIRLTEKETLRALENDLKKRIFGQDKALNFLADSVIIGRSGLRESNKPQTSVMFRGPTGVGKTEAALTLAAALKLPFHRIDMSEYSEAHSAAGLIGTRPGYVGYKDGQGGGGTLINIIEETPACVLLLDEIEKGHENVQNLCLQIMDHAKLTSGNGKTVRFDNVILIMTTNSGARADEAEPIGFGKTKAQEDKGGKEFDSTFTPEFRNRFDAVIKFNQLGIEEMELVVKKKIGDLAEMSIKKGVFVSIDDEATNWIAKEAMKEKLGARPVDRVIQEKVKKPLSKFIAFTDDPQKEVVISLKENEIVLDI